MILALLILAALAWLEYSPPDSLAAIHTVAFSWDGKRLAAGNRSGVVEIFRTNPWGMSLRLGSEGSRLNDLAFSPSGHRLATAGDGIAIWDPSSGVCTRRLGTPDSIYGSIAFHPDGSQLAAISHRERIEIWNPVTGKQLRDLCCSALAGDVAFSPDGKLLASSGHALRLWNLSAGGSARTLEESNFVTLGVAFSPDGKLLAAGNQDRTIHLWDVATGKRTTRLAGHNSYVIAVAFHPAGKWIASLGADGNLKLYTLTGAESISLVAPEAHGEVAVHPSGKWLTTGSSTGKLELLRAPQ
ncbi:MAG: WD40 repeat domain-containing protein [bacterium]|nr:WD40 repeat domain-containing protein [bacterium]